MCDFKTLVDTLKKKDIFDTNMKSPEEIISERSQFWEKHESFKPENWQIIPLKKKTTYSYMEFAFEKELHWEDPVIDPLFESVLEEVPPAVCILAATACGKTSSIYRAFSKHYGFYFCCDVSTKLAPFDTNVTTRDYLMGEFHRTLYGSSDEQIIAFGNNLSLLVYISRLLCLFIECNGKKVTPSQFLKLQINANTENSGDIFEWLKNQKYHHATSEQLMSLLKDIISNLKKMLNLKSEHSYFLLIKHNYFVLMKKTCY